MCKLKSLWSNFFTVVTHGHNPVTGIKIYAEMPHHDYLATPPRPCGNLILMYGFIGQTTLGERSGLAVSAIWTGMQGDVALSHKFFSRITARTRGNYMLLQYFHRERKIIGLILLMY